MTLASPLSTPAAQWQNAKALFPLYAALSREFVIDVPGCADLEAGGDSPSKDSVESAGQWLHSVDSHIQVHQLRQFLQTTTLSSEEALKALLLHHLGKSEHGDSDRDKIDFLLVQFFSQCAPPRLDETQATHEYVAKALAPVLGAEDAVVPDWLEQLDSLMQEANSCPNLNTLFTSRIIERGRKIKTSAGEKYFTPAAMVAFTRFSFLMRRVFFRLMHQDLNAILDGLRELERRGVATLDCRKAQFSAEEPVDRLRMICQSWKVMFHAEYSSGQALAMLVDLRTAVDAALTKSSKAAPSAAAPAAQAKAAAATAGFNTAASDTPEFEVSAAAPEWDAGSGNAGQ